MSSSWREYIWEVAHMEPGDRHGPDWKTKTSSTTRRGELRFHVGLEARA